LEGASGALSISVNTRALATTPSKRTLRKWNCVGGLELPYEVGEEVLFMLGGRRNGFQSAFLVRSCDGFEILVLLILDQKDFLVFDFFVHLTMYLMTPIAVYGQR